LTEEKPGFWTSNGKKFVVILTGGVSLTVLAAIGKVDPYYVILYWFGVGGVSAGAITR